MKTGLFLIISLLFVGLAFYSCQEDRISSEYPFEATVIRRNIDCGLYEIEITKGLEDVISIVGSSPSEGIYIAKNLPEDLEVDKLLIKLDIRKPKNNELGPCTAMGPAYIWLFVTKAEKK